ncbi:MAG: DUF805 domain-containing protein [Duncaniella sp.]|nr:DUF805 domain-containing protein [Duncaniella sp.]MDE6417583.1 DUF805 domain-containing protein [Duncaniella sp.]
MFQRQLTFGEAVRKCLQANYCNFSGRASRSEYWWFCLFTFIAGLVFGFISVFSENLGAILNWIFTLAVLLPSLGVSVRRLHDVGRSGWWLLLCLTGIGGLVILYWDVQPSQPVPNEYGDVPNMTA